MAQGAEQTRVLEFWRMVELFTPQKVPKLDRRSIDLKVIAWRPGDPLPWEALPPAKPKYVWQHQIYLGVYELAHIYETLRKLFAQDPDAHDLRVPGRSACAGLVVDSDGFLVGESVTLSSCAWALGEVNAGRHTRPGWSVGFEVASGQFQAKVTEQDELRQDEAGAEDPIPVDDEFLRWLHHTARTTSHMDDISAVPSEALTIRSKQVYASTAGDLTDFDFMNSFFLEDLRSIQQAASEGDSGVALAQYLTPADALETSRRIDVVATPGAVDARTGAESTPPGRWPSNPDHPLALSQQFAVNCALGQLGSRCGLMGVNGPPGTGKTTLLRDLIAGNVVERARRLAALDHPKRAFTDEVHQWKSGDWPRKVPQLRPELTGFEMVVASANNAAVENVTEEIPAADAIKEPWAGEVDHFTELASNILKRGQEGPAGTESDVSPDDGDEESRTADVDAAWGLIAARLGNKSNRGAFVSAFWFGKGGPGPDRGMSHILTEWAKEPHESWKASTKAFDDVAARVESLRRERRAAEQRIARRVSVRADLDEAAAALEVASEEADRAATLLPHIERDLSARVTEHQQAEHSRQRHLDAKPGALETIFTFGAASRQWRADLAPLDAHLHDREQARTALEGHLHAARQAAAQASERQQVLLNRCAALSDEARQLEGALARDEETYGAAYPGAKWTGDARELTAPWLDTTYNEARSDLFIAALALHRAFIHHLAGDLKSAMNAACEVVQGKAPRTLPPEATLAAWQLFGLFVPVVSTTFHSVGRMFRGLERESLGWLLIDEAGQCTPQQAVGAIWRAKRVVAVGDPMQLQPVVPIPPKAINDMAHTYGVDDLWIPPQASVQTLTDRTSAYGTTLHNQEEPVWVSSPLRVHRRCDDPMFTVSNAIAYDGLMISAVHRPPAEEDPFSESPRGVEGTPDDESGEAEPEVPSDSYWDDVPSTAASDSHLQPQETKRVRAAVAYLHDRCGVPYDQIFAVSPFRAVADALRGIADDHPGMRGGTVHTAQGREADVVLLVLGTSTAKGGARAWAASTPNLLNVAASRARRRLYVFGDYDNWAHQKYFATLAHHLPRRRQTKWIEAVRRSQPGGRP